MESYRVGLCDDEKRMLKINNHYMKEIDEEYEELSDYVKQTLTASKELKADFLGLATAVENHSPENFRLLSRDFPDLLPELELSITVSGQLRHTNDMRDS